MVENMLNGTNNPLCWQDKGTRYILRYLFIGNRYIHLLTSRGNVEIRVDIDDFEGQHRYAKYSTFKVSGPEDNYRLTIGGYSGDAGLCTYS